MNEEPKKQDTNTEEEKKKAEEAADIELGKKLAREAMGVIRSDEGGK